MSIIDFTSLFSHKAEWNYVLILSFEMDPSFFESDLLPKLSVRTNITLVIDDDSYRTLTSAAETRHRLWGISYNIERIKVVKGGRFHPKLYLFVNDDKLVVILGSANLTKSGFTHNKEILLKIDCSLNFINDDAVAVITQLEAFLTDTFTKPNTLIESVSPSLQRNIFNILASPFFVSFNERRINSKLTGATSTIRFMHTLQAGIYSQLVRHCGNQWKSLQILSPYYDESCDHFEKITKMSPKVSVYIPASGSTFPKEKIGANKKLKDKLTFFQVEAPDKCKRFIHAKYYRVNVENRQFDLVTSANFSSAGFFNDDYPRNLEIGILSSALSQKFLSDSGIDSLKIEGFDSIITDQPHAPQDTDEHLSHVIDTAWFSEGKIFFKLMGGHQIPGGLTDKKIQVSLNDSPLDKLYKIVDQDTGMQFVEPEQEIEGNQIIKIRLVSENEKYKSPNAIVNRECHEPRHVPSLGASAFNECMKIGGVEGIERAFEYAQKSDRKDWLLFLLSHWDLEKILLGIQQREEPDGEAPATDDIPSLPRANVPNNNDNLQLKSNLATSLSVIDIFENLQDFSERLMSIDSEICSNFTKYWFPIVMELSKYFSDILSREETKKRFNPSIRFPRYTWLHNYKKYEKYAGLISRELETVLPRISVDAGLNNFKTQIREWIAVNTPQTHRELLNNCSNYKVLSSKTLISVHAPYGSNLRLEIIDKRARTQQGRSTGL